MTFITSTTVKHSYFLRDKNNKNLFLHPYKETKTQVGYIFKPGTVGAAIWNKKAAKNFIKTGNEPLEMVKVDEVLKIEKSPLTGVIHFIEDLEKIPQIEWDEQQRDGFFKACKLIKSYVEKMLK